MPIDSKKASGFGSRVLATTHRPSGGNHRSLRVSVAVPDEAQGEAAAGSLHLKSDATHDATSSGDYETGNAATQRAMAARRERDLNDLTDAEVAAIRASRLPSGPPTDAQRAMWTPWDKHWTVFGFLLAQLGYPQTSVGTRDALHELLARRIRSGGPLAEPPSKTYVATVLETARIEGRLP